MASARGDGHNPRTTAERERLARERLAAELAALPMWGSSAFQAWLAQTDIARTLAPGALVHCLRRAVADGDLALQELLFVALLRRIERQNIRWAHRSLARSLLGPDQRESVHEELKQELTLALWQRVAREHDSAWELYFSRALDYAQRHTAHAFLVRNGYWRSAAPPIIPLAALHSAQTIADAGEHEATMPINVAVSDPFVGADLADLRDLVGRLPYRERVAVVMRFWLAASEHDIAGALGVTSRTVRNLLARAQKRLRFAYVGSADPIMGTALVPVAGNDAARRHDAPYDAC